MDRRCYHVMAAVLLISTVCVEFVTAYPIKRARHRICNSRMDVKEAMRMLQDQNPNKPCIGKYVANHDVLRVPQVIPEIVCPAGTGDQCIQIVLPMNATYRDASDGRLVSHIIHVPSGCIDRPPPSHQLSTGVLGKSHKITVNKAGRSRHKNKRKKN